MHVITRDYQGHAIVLQDDGWFNATQAADQMGRRVDHWLAKQETKDYIAALVEITNTPFPGYLKTKRGAAGGAVTVEELNPNLPWSRIPDKSWPHPKGRPVVDVSLAKEAA